MRTTAVRGGSESAGERPPASGATASRATASRATASRATASAATAPGAPAPTATTPQTNVRLVLFDRDGTLVHDVPYNGDPSKVRPIGDAVTALMRLREAGIRLGVVTNQSGIAKGLITAADELAVRARIVDMLGPFDTWQVCPHDSGDGCGCRKPAPGMIHAACAATGIPPSQTVVIGDIAADIAAAGAAGARAILVPTAATLADEVRSAPVRATTLREAATLILDGKLTDGPRT